MGHLNLCIKKWGSPSSFRRKRPFISLNSSSFIEKLSSSKGVHARVRANHAKSDAQKGCVMQLNWITIISASAFVNFCCTNNNIETGRLNKHYSKEVASFLSIGKHQYKICGRASIIWHMKESIHCYSKRDISILRRMWQGNMANPLNPLNPDL